MTETELQRRRCPLATRDGNAVKQVNLSCNPPGMNTRYLMSLKCFTRMSIEGVVLKKKEIMQKLCSDQDVHV